VHRLLLGAAGQADVDITADEAMVPEAVFA